METVFQAIFCGSYQNNLFSMCGATVDDTANSFIRLRLIHGSAYG
jgi:hypothetical protein